MHKKGFEKFTVDNIVNKMKKLRQRFKKEVDNKRKTGTGKPKTTWKFFKNVDEIIGHRPNVCPVFCIDTSAVEKQEDTEVKNDKGSCPVTVVKCKIKAICKPNINLYTVNSYRIHKKEVWDCQDF